MELSNFNINFNNRILRILIIALLIFCMVFGGFMIQYCHAELVISTSIIVAATFLVACGVIAQSDVDLYAIAQDFITFLGPLAVVLNQTYKWVSGSTFHITNALMEKLAEYISLKFQADVNGSSTGTITSSGGSNLVFDGIDLSFLPFFSGTPDIYSDAVSSKLMQVDELKKFMVLNTQKNEYILQLPYFVSIPSSTYTKPYIWLSTSTGSSWNLAWQFYYEDKITGSPCSPTTSTYGLSLGLCNYDGYYRLIYTEGCDTYVKSFESSPTTDAGVTAKANSTYFPQTGKKALTTSVPLTYPESMTGLVTGGINGVRSDLADVGTDVGVISGTLSGLWETVKGIGTTISTGITSIVGAIAGFFDVSEFSLDLNPLKIGLTKVFPFCIPFDMLRGIKTLASNPTAFVYDIKLDTKFFDINHTVNLSPYRVPILFFRYIVDFWFIWILISRTRDLMKW